MPLLIPRLPGKSVNAVLFFVAFPVVAFFLLHGGGIKGFGISWTADILSGISGSIAEGGRQAGACPSSAIRGHRAAAVADRQASVLIGTVISFCGR